MESDHPLVLSTTGFNDASMCMRRYYYHHVVGLTPKPDRVHPRVRRGLWIHKAIADHYRGKDWRASIADAAAWVVERGVPQDVSQSIADECVRILEAYFTHWKEVGDDDGWTILAVEEPLYLDLAKGVRLRATVDAVIKRRNGGTWIVEHKTTSDIPSPSWRAIDPQTAIQVAAAEPRFGRVEGIIFDYILTRKPPSPKLSGGRLTLSSPTSKTTSAVFEVAAERLRRLWEGDEARVEEIIDRSRKEIVDDGVYFQRYEVHRPQEAVDAILIDAAALVAEIKRAHASGVWRRNIHIISCQRFCPYSRLCAAELVMGRECHGMREMEFDIGAEREAR